VDEATLREYAGVYQWGPNAYLYLQLWDEFAGFGNPAHLVAFDESGDVRTLYPTDRDRFFAGPGAAISTAVESRITFERERNSEIRSLTWHREGAAARTARRVDVETYEDVSFSNGNIHLVGRLVSPSTIGKHPAIILVHGSGAENREYMLPWARFLVRRGMAILGYDKRGVGASTGDWSTASFDDLAGDVLAAFEYLKSRTDIDGTQIGLLGVSQAGWIMPLAAVRAKDIAFLISISGAGVPPAETTIDQARNEITMTGMPRQAVDQIINVLRLQYAYARTGEGWEAYLSARATLAARMGTPPDTIPGTQEHPHWQLIRRLYFYDPAPTLRQLQVPTLAIFGELDNNIVADKNKAAWEEALRVANNRDYSLQILPKANHIQWEAKIGSNAEMASLRGFVPAYCTTIVEWLSKRIRGFQRPA
jgi:pimeloyl-ACP methyl ester carboxylesterase